jgi:hypothetical protein
MWHPWHPDPQRQQKRFTSVRVLSVLPLHELRQDSWARICKRLPGKNGDDGIERVTTQTLFDILEVPQHGRGAGACRRLAKLMTELGWTAVRVRDLTRGGYREQVRGYCRDARNERHQHS